MLTRPPLSISAPCRPVLACVQLAPQSVDLKRPRPVPSHTMAASKGSTITAFMSLTPAGPTRSHVPTAGSPLHALALGMIVLPPAPPLPAAPPAPAPPPAPPLPA